MRRGASRRKRLKRVWLFYSGDDARAFEKGDGYIDSASRQRPAAPVARATGRCVGALCAALGPVRLALLATR
jgi:hypothetical protein